MLIDVLNNAENDLLQYLRRYAYKGVNITDEDILNRIRATATATAAHERRSFALNGSVALAAERKRIKQAALKIKNKKTIIR